VKFYFHPEANEELDEAVRYYENLRPGLGLEFAEEVYSTIARIARYPDAWPPISTKTRRCLMNRFPYGVIFQVKSDILRIIAVTNLHRRPGYWKQRI
jgi:hypothetical protein